MSRRERQKWNDITYEGEWKNGIPEGKGKEYKEYEGQQRIIYEGEWKNGKREGKGIEYDKTEINESKIYEGEWKNGVYEGKGTLYIANKKWYEGNWKNGVPEGWAIQNYGTHEDDVYYEGGWKIGHWEGKGIHYDKNKAKVCQGEHKDGKWDGFGILYYGGEKMYEGEWKDGLCEGKGIGYENGEKIYEGEWKRGEREKGTGKWRGGSFSGSWYPDKNYSEKTITLWLPKIRGHTTVRVPTKRSSFPVECGIFAWPSGFMEEREYDDKGNLVRAREMTAEMQLKLEKLREMEKLETKIDTITQDLTEKEHANEALTNRVDELTTELQDSKTEIEKLEEQLRGLRKQMEELDSKTRRDLNNKDKVTKEQRTEIQDQQEQIHKLTSELEVETQKTICQICYENKRNSVIMPCMHFLYCNKCLSSQKNCPVCRQPIMGIVQCKLEL